jgi:hypothetical protein
MQPYFIPYLGYWHLMHAVDTFVLYDDIKYVKNGWMNRNRMLFGDRVEYVTVPITKDSDHLAVRERSVSPEWQQHRERYLRKMRQCHRSRPNFKVGMEVANESLGGEASNLFEFLYSSIVKVRDTLGIDTEILVSSRLGDFRDDKGEDKVKAICRSLGAARYVNPIGGKDLYRKESFANDGLTLQFVASRFPEYVQGDAAFVPGLSILDLLMSVDGSGLKRQLTAYELE